jgi:hypothetical protein
MNRSVKVTANDAGQVVNVSENNPDYGYIRVEQDKPIFDDNGWARLQTISALVPGTVKDLQAFNWTAGKVLPGNIIITESLTPFNAKNPERDYKIAGDTGIVCCEDGQPIYRRNVYTESTSKSDVFIAHTNTEDIKAAHANSVASKEAEVEANLED